MVRAGVSSHDDWADAAADVFCPEVYQPMLNPVIGQADEGGHPIQPGDAILGRRITNNEARQIYDIQHGEWLDAWSESDDHSY
jgi:hypothetical protein